MALPIENQCKKLLCKHDSIFYHFFKIGQKSAAQGFPESRLPEFNSSDSEIIRGSADFFGLNYYTGRVVRPQVGLQLHSKCKLHRHPIFDLQESDINDVSWFADSDTFAYSDPTWVV